MFLLLINADLNNNSNDAILIGKGKILKIGSGDYLKRIAGPEVKILDLEGRRVLPGLIDSHTHLISYGLSLSRPRLEKCTSPLDVIETVKSYISKHKPEGILIAGGYDDSSWSADLTRELLDKSFPTQPVAIRRICGHKTVVNQKVLEILPKNLKSVNWQEGILLEKPSLNLNRIFPPTEDELQKALEVASQKMLALGVTTFHDIMNHRHLQTYLSYKGIMPRVRAYLRDEDGKYLPKIGLKSGFGNDYIKIMGIKIFLDGSIGARTAALSKSYADTKTRGQLLLSKEKVNFWFEIAEASSLQLMVHAIGDRAIDTATSVTIESGNPLRHRIEHAEILDDQHIDKIFKKNLMLSMQPNFMHFWGKEGGLYEVALGKTRFKLLNRFKSIIDRGIKMGFGTDLMPPDPCFVIKGAVEHFVEEERLDFSSAVRYYTEGSAYLTFDEGSLGKIEEGYRADLIIVGRKKEDFDIFLTILDGKIIKKSG